MAVFGHAHLVLGDRGLSIVLGEAADSGLLLARIRFWELRREPLLSSSCLEWVQMQWIYLIGSGATTADFILFETSISHWLNTLD